MENGHVLEILQGQLHTGQGWRPLFTESLAIDMIGVVVSSTAAPGTRLGMDHP